MSESAIHISRLEAERDFLLARSDEAGACRFGKERWTGTSSNALVRFVFGGATPEKREYPHDPSDFHACELTVERLPAHLAPLAAPIMKWYREAVSERYDLATGRLRRESHE